MEDVKGKILLIDREHYDELFARLEKKKSPKIVVIDSVQYMTLIMVSTRN
jgi:predicted ATP-dependent serine protease